MDRGNTWPAASRRDALPWTFAVLVVCSSPGSFAITRLFPQQPCRDAAVTPYSRQVTIKRDEMPRILLTGASGGIGTSLRKLLPAAYPDLLLSDLKPPADLKPNEKFRAAELSELAQVEAICEGIDGILHFGGQSVEGSWDQVLQSNIIGCYNLFEAARKKGVKRVVFASSNHAIGFIRAITTSAPPSRRDPTAA